MSKSIVIFAVLAGLLFLISSVIYFIEPAKSLPAFFPGHDVTLNRHHYTHAIGTLILGIGAFIFVWFQSGSKKTSK